MGAPRRRNLIASRRRTDDDGEDDGSVVTGQEDDLSSLGSAQSEADVDADADGEGSDGSDAARSRRAGAKRKNARNGKTTEHLSASRPSNFATMTDTEAMMNGLQISDDPNEGETINFDEPAQSPAVADKRGAIEEPSRRVESPADRRKREHEEYKKKRDEDPAFVPNRGGFFMHDQRTAFMGQNGFRPAGRGRARGRGGFMGASPFNLQVSSNASDAPWAHDLHESVADAEPSRLEATKPDAGVVTPQQQKVPASAQTNPPPNRSFSRSAHVGNVQLRVLIPGMKDPVVFSGVPVHQHTRLPHHRPPLRRDKPVRISLPEFPPRYIFPAMDRSFIFIPRAMRPNQQGFGRGRGRGSFSGYGGFTSARNSIFGGSTYTPSIAMSRRSSIARELGRDGMASPSGSVISRNRGVLLEASKPVVRLPPAIDLALISPQPAQQPQFGTSPAPVVNLPQPQAYPLPQKPGSQNWTSPPPMHQPKPQKQVSVAEIESPAALNFPPPQQQQQQPFHQQVPAVLNGQPFVHDPNIMPHSRHPSHPSQKGTPLSQIPERAIHAQPFQPYPGPFQQPHSFYPQQYSAPVYYYAPPAPSMASPSVSAPAFVPGQQYPYMIPAAPMPATAEPTTQPGTVAHESNGMVYYYDSSQLASSAEDGSNYQHMGFVPSTGYVVPQGTVFYPAQ